jgi:hypothetical protein
MSRKDDDESRVKAVDVYRLLGGRKIADGEYQCHCPGSRHRNGDKNPSLSVKDGRNKHGYYRLLLYCHALCDFHEIRNTLRRRGLDL